LKNKPEKRVAGHPANAGIEDVVFETNLGKIKMSPKLIKGTTGINKGDERIRTAE
jgi:hypothetical protein